MRCSERSEGGPGESASIAQAQAHVLSENTGITAPVCVASASPSFNTNQGSVDSGLAYGLHSWQKMMMFTTALARDQSSQGTRRMTVLV